MSGIDEKTIELSRKKLGITPRKGSIPFMQILTGENAGQILLLDRPEAVVGRDTSCEIQLQETGISRRHARFASVPGSVTLEDLESTNGTYVGEKPITRVSLSRGETISFGGAVLAKFDYQTRGELEINQEIYEHVTSDILTKTLKHEAFLERLRHQRAIALRDNTQFALLVTQIDNFTKLAQTSVHDVAYVLLKQFADVLRRSTRLDDLIGRFDHETFMIYLHGTQVAETRVVAERILKNVAKTPFKITTGERTLELNLTASVGVAQWTQSVSLEVLCSSAEFRLQEAVKAGGGRVSADFEV